MLINDECYAFFGNYILDYKIFKILKKNLKYNKNSCIFTDCLDEIRDTNNLLGYLIDKDNIIYVLDYGCGRSPLLKMLKEKLNYLKIFRYDPVFDEYKIYCCASGIGVSMVANRNSGIRAVNASIKEHALFARLHEDANVLCFGQKYVDFDFAIEALKVFMTTKFEGGRHLRRINKH